VRRGHHRLGDGVDGVEGKVERDVMDAHHVLRPALQGEELGQRPCIAVGGGEPCVFLTLSRQHFHRLLKDAPQVRAAVERAADARRARVMD
jgi:hypothetical protein